MTRPLMECMMKAIHGYQYVSTCWDSVSKDGSLTNVRSLVKVFDKVELEQDFFFFLSFRQSIIKQNRAFRATVTLLITSVC